MTENSSVIIDERAAPIQTSGTYVGLAQKVFEFATAADAAYWAFLQSLPTCRVFNNDSEQIASIECDYYYEGTRAYVNAPFTTRVNTAGAVGVQNTYFFRFVDILGDIRPQGVSIYH